MDKTKIDWADSTWNPVTGCHHGCKYCYARGMVRRFEGFYDSNHGKNDKVVGGLLFSLDKPMRRMTEAGKIIRAAYPYGFTPTFHRYRLDEYKNKMGRTIFVTSMGDLFGEIIPDEWIKEVFAACADAPQHRYLFLTKNPKRYNLINPMVFASDSLGSKIWFGTTVTRNCELGRMGQAPLAFNQFVSIEPILEPLKDFDSAFVQWVIIGAENGNMTDRVIPAREWIDNIVENCRATGTAVFMKESLRVLMGDDFIQEFPWVI